MFRRTVLLFKRLYRCEKKSILLLNGCCSPLCFQQLYQLVEIFFSLIRSHNSWESLICGAACPLFPAFFVDYLLSEFIAFLEFNRMHLIDQQVRIAKLINMHSIRSLLITRYSLLTCLVYGWSGRIESSRSAKCFIRSPLGTFIIYKINKRIEKKASGNCAVEVGRMVLFLLNISKEQCVEVLIVKYSLLLWLAVQ